MTDPGRPDWYHYIYSGLWESKHVAQMGSAIWLYGWILARAHVAQQGGLLEYTHLEAARDLGRDEKTIRRWFSTLEEHGYVLKRARRPYSLQVEVSKWRTIDQWLKSRPHGERTFLPTLSERPDISVPENGHENGHENGQGCPFSHITIKLLGYNSPSGSGSPDPAPNMAEAFGRLLDQLRESKNKSAALREIYILCFGEADAPDYGYLGKVARRVGGAGRLAELMWGLTAKRPSGDVLDYIQGLQKSRNNNGHKGQTHEEKLAIIERHVSRREGHDGD